MSADSGLYGVRKPKNTVRELSSSTTLAFTSQLSSVISGAGETSGTSIERPRPSNRNKPSLFTAHRRAKAADARKQKQRSTRPSDDDEPRAAPSTTAHHAPLDDHDRHRARRKMEEKARLYAAMKRGDYVASQTAGDLGDGERGPLVDFDRKWAAREEARAAGGGRDEDVSSDDGWSSASAAGDDDDDAVLVTFEDEFGRTRRGTQAEARRMARRQQNRLLGQEELERMSARPTAPATVIRGDTIQYAAFNPDAQVVEQMAALAAKRDRTPTPPPPTHYNAAAEVRTRGVGFYQFSRDETLRAREMDDLARQRADTERRRAEREQEKLKRKRDIAERRRLVGEKRAKKQADDFLDGLTKD